MSPEDGGHANACILCRLLKPLDCLICKSTGLMWLSDLNLVSVTRNGSSTSRIDRSVLCCAHRTDCESRTSTYGIVTKSSVLSSVSIQCLESPSHGFLHEDIPS
jgi:hypothetical protein